jgi:3-hydroxyisobutyrate dehydrogenase/2-hydroxy-3-oxopropionate reductase
MARRFAAADFDLILWNRDRAKADEVAEATGGQVAETPADAASRAPFTLSSLADDDAVRTVYLEEGGVVEGLRAGSIAIDTSTVSPLTIHDVGEAVDAAGAGFADCPVSGSVSTVDAGSLLVIAGGEPALISKVEPLLEPIAKRVLRVGDRGAGAACKLAVNGLVHGLNIALSEALVLAERAGVERSLAYEVFASGAGGAPFVAYKRDAYEHPEDTPVAFSLDLVAKDLDLITALGRAVGASMRQADVGLEIVNEAIHAGLGDRDLSAVAVHLRERAG